MKLKGKPLNVKSGGVIKNENKRKKRHKFQQYCDDQSFTGGNSGLSNKQSSASNVSETDEDQGNQKPKYDDHLTPAERRYLDQLEKIDIQRMAKMASKSHRDRIQEFNQYLANLSEHYDIPKVGPG